MFRHFHVDKSLRCDADHGAGTPLSCPAYRARCLKSAGATIGACVRPAALAQSPPPAPPPADVICRNTCGDPSSPGTFEPRKLGDGRCSDGGLGSAAFGSPAKFDCAYGTDCADCGPRPAASPTPVLCTNTCTGYEYAYDQPDGTTTQSGCRDSFVGRIRKVWETDADLFPGTGHCGHGTDCAKCGVRSVGTITTDSTDPYVAFTDMHSWPLSYVWN